jgi:hypothetical protein
MYVSSKDSDSREYTNGDFSAEAIFIHRRNV